MNVQAIRPRSPVTGAELIDRELIELFDRAVVTCPVEAMPWRITPALAAHILSRNFGNRELHGKRAAYTNDMRDGRWSLTGQTIIISSDRYLLDGQNRLRACVDSGAEFCSYIVFGINADTFPDIDSGKTRSGSDVLTMAGVPNATAAAAATRWVLLLQQGRVKSRAPFAPKEIREAIARLDQPLLQEGIRAGQRIWKVYGQDRHPISMLAGLYYVLSQINRPLAVEFFGAMETGRFAGRVGAIDKALRRIREEKHRASGRLNEVVRLAFLILAWNLAARNRVGTLSEFQWDVSQDFPAIFEG